MSVNFKILSVQFPNEYTEDQIKSFFENHTSLKAHENPEKGERFITHH